VTTLETVKRVRLAIPHSEAQDHHSNPQDRLQDSEKDNNCYGVLRLIATFPGIAKFESTAKSVKEALEDRHPLGALRHDCINEAFPASSTSLFAPRQSVLSSLQLPKPREISTPVSGSESFQRNVGVRTPHLKASQSSYEIPPSKRPGGEQEDGPQAKRPHLEPQIEVRRSRRERKPVERVV